jgi:hypothetical protein
MILQWILVGFGGLLILVGILRQVDWFNFFNKFYGNDPEKGKIYVDFGENELFYDGYYLYSDDVFMYYNYDIGKHNFTVRVPIRWHYVFVRGRRKICVDFGHENAKPLYTGDAYMSTMGAELLNKSIDKRLAVAMVNSLESRKGFKIGMILIIAVIVIGGILWWRSQSKPETPVTPVPTEQQQTQQPPGTKLTLDQLTDQELKDLMKGQ